MISINVYIGVFAVLFLFSQKDSSYFSMYLTIIVLITMCLVFGIDMEEGFQVSNEAIQNVSAIYNTGKLTVTNADVGDTLTAKKINVGEGIVARTVSGGKLTMLSPNSTDIFDVSLERKDEDNKSHSWSLWHMNKQYGQNDLQFWEYKTGDDGKTCGSTTGICGPRFSLLAGGGARLENDLTVKGNVTINGISNMNPLRRKHDVAGYFKIRAFGRKTPLYYGWNQLWPDHNYAINLMARHKIPLCCSDVDMRNAGDNDKNWTPRHLVVFPGYVARLYYWDVPSTPADVYTTGEYDWENYVGMYDPVGRSPNGSPGNGLRVHVICITYAEDGAFADTRKPSELQS